MNRRLFLSLPLAAALATAQNPADRLDAQVRAWQDVGRFNGSVLVAREGRVLLAKGYGMANYEWQIPNGADTKFRLGSITKQFTAASILQLELQGKLKTSDPVCNFVERCPDAWKPLTVHHLLTHTSGIPNFTSFPDYGTTMAQASTMPDLLRRFRDKPLEFEPGSKFTYSNSGYVLLGHILEKAAGVTYEEYVRKNIFEPLGMQDTGYDRNAKVLPKRAAGYQKRGEDVSNAAHIDMTIPHAAGALYSTVEDLYRWDRALLTDKLLPQAARDRMFTPFKSDYAYGWNVRTQNGVQVISHGGGINGFATMIMRAPEKDLCVVTLTNVLPSEAGKVAGELFRLALGDEVALPKPRVEISVKPEILDRYTGDYELRPGFAFKVWRDGEKLMTQATGQPAVQIFAESETRFFPKVVDATLIFEPDAEGRMTLTLEQGGGRTKAVQAPALRAGVSVQLPVTRHAVPLPEADRPGALVVALTAKGDVYLEITPAAPAELAEKLKAYLANRGGKTLFVKADARVAYANLAKLLDAVRQAGVESFSLLTSQPASPEPSYPVPPKGLQIMLGPVTQGAVALKPDEKTLVAEVVRTIDERRGAGAQVTLAR